MSKINVKPVLYLYILQWTANKKLHSPLAIKSSTRGIGKQEQLLCPF